MACNYYFAQVAQAAEMPSTTLARWLDTGIIKLRAPDVDSASSGVPRQFSLPRVLQVAVTHRLVRAGVAPSRAATAATAWTDHPPQDLLPGAIYDSGGTWLVADDDGGRVLALPADAALSDVLAASPGAVTLVDLRRLHAHILDRLSVQTTASRRGMSYEIKA